jgi:hypothetical protein
VGDVHLQRLDVAAFDEGSVHDIGMSVLGSGALVLLVAGLITKSEAVLVALAVVTVVMWLVSTTAHALTRRPDKPVAVR